MDNENNTEQKIDLKEILSLFLEEQKPELSQKEAIKAYREEEDGKITFKINSKTRRKWYRWWRWWKLKRNKKGIIKIFRKSKQSCIRHIQRRKERKK